MSSFYYQLTYLIILYFRYDKALDEGRKLTLNKYYGLAIAIAVNYGSLMIMYSIGLFYGSYLYLWGDMDVGKMTSVSKHVRSILNYLVLDHSI